MPLYIALHATVTDWQIDQRRHSVGKLKTTIARGHTNKRSEIMLVWMPAAAAWRSGIVPNRLVRMSVRTLIAMGMLLHRFMRLAMANQHMALLPKRKAACRHYQSGKRKRSKPVYASKNVHTQVKDVSQRYNVKKIYFFLHTNSDQHGYALVRLSADPAA